jgi:hypothetical protein
VKLDLGGLAGARTVVLVEGMSDKAALEALAGRRGRSLAGEGVVIVAMGGATNAGHFLEALGPHGLCLRLAGLFDAAEEACVRRAMARAGLGSGLSLTDMEARGFYACAADLEDELIRALGAGAVEQVIRAEGESRSFSRFQKQPAQRRRGLDRQLHRFLGTRSGRKSRYARLLTEALDPSRVPRPLDRVLARL